MGWSGEPARSRPPVRLLNRQGKTSLTDRGSHEGGRIALGVGSLVGDPHCPCPAGGGTEGMGEITRLPGGRMGGRKRRPGPGR